VPDDGENDRHGDQQMKHARFPDAGRAKAVVVDLSVKRPLRGAGHDRGGEAGAGRLVRVDLLDAADVDGGQWRRQQ
jgi:hypothetical protein